MAEQIEPQLALGSKLTIISKAGIRYEGTLYLIDTVKESIALQNVKFYGTEDRRVAKHFAPKSEIFECIVFKAADLQDLTLVAEEQDRPADSLSFHDPAVISSKPAAPSFENETMKQESLTFVNRQLSSSEDSMRKSSASNNSAAYPTSEMNGGKHKHQGYPSYDSSRGQGASYRSSGPDWGRPRNPPPPQAAPTARGSGTVSFTQDFDFEEANSRFKKDEFAEEFRKKLKLRNSLSVSQAEDDSSDPAPAPHSPTAPKPVAGENTGPSSAETTPTPAKPSSSAPSDEKGREPGELNSEDESEDSGVDIACYDKTKSFFDQISTDNPGNKRGKFREERSLNSQTFGVSSPPPGTGSRRGPRRGMRRGSDYPQYRNSGGPGGYSEYRNPPRREYEYEYEYYPPHPPRNRGYAPRGYRRSTGPPNEPYYQGYPPAEDYYDMHHPPPQDYYRPPQQQHRSDRGPPYPRGREDSYSTSYVQSKTFRNSRIATASSGNKQRDRDRNN